MSFSRRCSSRAYLSSLSLLVVVLSSWKVDSFSSPPLRAAHVSHHPIPSQQLNTQSSLANIRRHSRIPLRTVTTEVELAEQYDPNGIVPETKSITGSMAFYARFVIHALATSQTKKRTRRSQRKRGERRKSFRENLAKLNEQRKNLVALAGYKSSIVVPSFTFLFLGALMTSIVPHYEAKCIQLVATLHPSRTKVVEALVGLVLTSSLASLFTGLRGSLFWLAGSRANYNVRVKLHRNLLLQEAAFFDSNEVGYLLSRLNNDVNKIGNVISYHVNVVCRQLAQFIFGSVVLWRISRELALWAFAGVGLVAWISAVYGDFARILAEKVQDTFADSTAVAETSLSMSETIRSFNGVEVDSKKYEVSQSRALELEEVQAFAYGTHKLISDTLQAGLHAGLLLACWTLGRSGGLQAAQLTTFMFYTNFVLESSNEVGDQWAKIQSAVGASSNVFDLIRRIPAIRDPPVPKNQALDESTIVPTAPPKLVATEQKNVALVNGQQQYQQQSTMNGHNQETTKPIIEMKNMTVTYGAMSKPALDGVDLEIYPDDRIAIVGKSGSGKSSMLRAILRFYDPSSGSIHLDGANMNDLSRKQIARMVSVVEQEPSLFPMSLLDNVLYGIEKDSVDPETGEPCYSESYRKAVYESLRLCGLPVEPGNDLSLELDTRVGEGGRALSGGQRQRTAIARAIIRSPEVLLLDEPTAALDSESEKKVVKALQRAMAHAKSMVMVTHRLGVVRALDVNRVIVMEHGKIVEAAHPETLLRQKDSVYAKLALEQGITALEQHDEEHLECLDISHL
ncbi:Sublancin-168-processing and transport ATP-binding protein sunT [Seminavis robusta]|uniref:Sublancin-168-processing and transport ATP-binding protein sunT n=1 Tax=Seminavis robusta TaxID=568900 RepID=A0A9N8EJF6_9STRA|nr:Sublancin-168-processing and transport ATP-binding protein sunT [Seminavis robusta]|eukprot:Sro1083_g239350.1 Sublancin-168-processing and transport ATP-binding protein sunT (794) ;mRNA; r:12917-15510